MFCRLTIIRLGGVVGLYDGRMDSLITGLQSSEGIKQVSYWEDINDPLPFQSQYLKNGRPGAIRE